MTNRTMLLQTLLVTCLLMGALARIPWLPKAWRLPPVPLLTTRSSSLLASQRHRHFENDNFSTVNDSSRRHVHYCPRGGGGGDDGDDRAESTVTKNEAMASAAEEEERYSRQVYAVGKRAHGLIRSCTIYLDGPVASGLLYETAKNLALSGIRKLVLVVPGDADDDKNIDQVYHSQETDDLGNAYRRAARTEINDNKSSDADILVEYIKRLNPFVDVSILTNRESLQQQQQDSASPCGRKVLVAIDRPYSTQLDLNRRARSNGMSFVSMETAGVFGRIFCDFGSDFQVHDADGETPLVTPLLRLESASFGQDDDDGHDDKLVTIHCMEDEKHDVSKGDTVRFQFRNGDYSTETCKVVEVKNPFQFVVQFNMGNADADDSHDHDAVIAKLNQVAVSFSRVKIPVSVNFVSLEEATGGGMPDSALFTACDLDKSWDDVRRMTSFACFHTLASFAEQQERLPGPKDRKSFKALLKETCGEELVKTGKIHIKNFVSGCAAKFSPLQAVFGAIGAQEALKAATGLYSPVQQFLLYDCDEVLGSMEETDAEPTMTQNDAGLRYILGNGVVNEVQSKRIFVVGAGAIGCEILKNLAVMGAATRGKGKVILTDMDTIEKSNLSRQFLFRDSDIGKFKSLAAKESVLRFQPSTNIEAHSAKVGASEDNAFSGNFWTKKVDTVLNALDNMDARLYIDGQCVANQKALVDAGTLGPKGNVQVVVPFQSESYASSADPPEQAIPVCTLKNFPYAISHTIQWGRDLFDGFFRSRPLEANKFVSALQESSSTSQIAGQATSTMGEEAVLTWADDLADDLGFVDSPGQIVQEALEWAARVAWKLFFNAIKELLIKHPLDSRDDDGEPFWSGSRRPPSPLKYFASPSTPDEQIINQNLVEFVLNAARLRQECYKSVPERGVEITTDDAVYSLSKFDFDGLTENYGANEGKGSSVVEKVRSKLDALASLDNFPEMQSADFEKDDDSNGHVAFVNAASNLRAICYGIPPVDAMETRRIAGNIIPAMITTTAFVSAMSCIELIKLVQEAPLTKHRNAFINLALPFFAFTVPLPAEPVPGIQGREYTLWDRLSIKESKKAFEAGGLTIKSLLSKLKKLASDDPTSVEVSSISLGPFLLYANFLHEDDKDFLKSSVWDAIVEALEDPDEGGREGEGDDSSRIYSVDDPSYVLSVVVEDAETSEEAELPSVSLKRYIDQ